MCRDVNSTLNDTVEVSMSASYRQPFIDPYLQSSVPWAAWIANFPFSTSPDPCLSHGVLAASEAHHVAIAIHIARMIMATRSNSKTL